MKNQINEVYIKNYTEGLQYFPDRAGKIESLQEFKIKLFEWLFHC